MPELLGTLSIMVIMCGIALPALQPLLEEARLRAVTSMVVGQLQYARSYAIANGTPTAVFFDTTNLGVGVMSAALTSSATNAETDELSAGTNAGSETNWQPVTTPAGRFRVLPTGVTLTDVSLTDVVYAAATGKLTSSAASTFTPAPTTSVTPLVNGTADEGQLITFSALGQGEDARITLQDVHGGTRTILVDALTGRCDLMDINNNDQTTLPNP